MDTYPITVHSLERYFKIDGKTLEKNYRDKLSDFSTWDQREHATEWLLIPENLGEHVCLDETMLNGDLVTIVSNPEAHCGQGAIIAVVSGTKAEEVSKILDQIPLHEREKVKHVTMDFSDSMHAIAQSSFPCADITIDHFHIIKRAVEAIEELRLRAKREAIAEQKKEEKEFKDHLKRLKKQRADYRKKHPKRPKGKKRGRKPLRAKSYRPSKLSNGDTKVELLTRSRCLLSQSGEKWSTKQSQRAALVFENHPKIKEAYGLVCSLRCILSNRQLDKTSGREKLHEWYGKISGCTLREMKAVRDLIKSREEDIVTFFGNRLSNAPAESLNSKLKAFRAQVRGVKDLSFFLYRVSLIFG